MIYGFSQVEGELKLRRSSQKGEKERKEQADAYLSDRMSSHGLVDLIFHIGPAVVNSPTSEFSSLRSGGEEVHHRLDGGKALEHEIGFVAFKGLQGIIAAGHSHCGSTGLLAVNDISWGISDNEDPFDFLVSSLMGTLHSRASQLRSVF